MGLSLLVFYFMEKIRITDLQKMKINAEKISMITAYDAPIASIVDEAGIDVVLVGDSLGNVVQGRSDTLSVTMDHMTYHTLMVSRGIKRAHLSCDMPFMSYQISKHEAIRNAGRLVKEGNAESVKLEVNEEYLETVYSINKAGIPVISHIGLCPQSIHRTGGYRVQGRSDEEGERLLELARSSQEAGAFLVVLESIPAKLAHRITQSLVIPTVGIGAGNVCDGQVLVFNDMAGLSPEPLPKFTRKYADSRNIFLDATKQYIKDVKESRFPGKENEYE